MRRILIVADRLLGGAELRERLALKKSTDPEHRGVRARPAAHRRADRRRRRRRPSRSSSSSWPCCATCSTRSTGRSATPTRWLPSARCSSVPSVRRDHPGHAAGGGVAVGAHGPRPPHAAGDQAAGGGGRRARSPTRPRRPAWPSSASPASRPPPARGRGAGAARRGRRGRRRADPAGARPLPDAEHARHASATVPRQSSGCARPAGPTGVDLVLVDLKMPVLDGFELLERLRGRARPGAARRRRADDVEPDGGPRAGPRPRRPRLRHEGGVVPALPRPAGGPARRRRPPVAPVLGGISPLDDVGGISASSWRGSRPAPGGRQRSRASS